VTIPRAAADATAPSSSAPRQGTATSSAAAKDLFVFLCPNGHKLNGPTSLQGKPGKCPHCGERFRIPLADDVDEFETEEQAAFDPTASAADLREYNEFAAFEESGLETFDPLTAHTAETTEFAEEVEFAEDAAEGSADGAAGIPPAGAVAPAEGADACRVLFERLWEEKQHGATVRIVLAPGEVYTPEWYSPTLSQATHGVFATRENGQYVLTAIAWDAIRRIDVLSLAELPPDAFV
jgi:hypothetical protein